MLMTLVPDKHSPSIRIPPVILTSGKWRGLGVKREGDCVEESDEVSEEDHHERVERHLLGHHIASLVDTNGEEGQQYSKSGNSVQETQIFFLFLLLLLILLQDARLLEEKVLDDRVLLQIKFWQLLHLVGIAPGLPVHILLT